MIRLFSVLFLSLLCSLLQLVAGAESMSPGGYQLKFGVPPLGGYVRLAILSQPPKGGTPNLRALDHTSLETRAPAIELALDADTYSPYLSGRTFRSPLGGYVSKFGVPPLGGYVRLAILSRPPKGGNPNLRALDHTSLETRAPSIELAFDADTYSPYLSGRTFWSSLGGYVSKFGVPPLGGYVRLAILSQPPKGGTPNLRALDHTSLGTRASSIELALDADTDSSYLSGLTFWIPLGDYVSKFGVPSLGGYVRLAMLSQPPKGGTPNLRALDHTSLGTRASSIELALDADTDSSYLSGRTFRSPLGGYVSKFGVPPLGGYVRLAILSQPPKGGTPNLRALDHTSLATRAPVVELTLNADTYYPGDVVELSVEIRRTDYGEFTIQIPSHPNLSFVDYTLEPIHYKAGEYVQRAVWRFQPLAAGEFTLQPIETGHAQAFTLPPVTIRVQSYGSVDLSDELMPLPMEVSNPNSGFCCFLFPSLILVSLIIVCWLLRRSSDGEEPVPEVDRIKLSELVEKLENEQPAIDLIERLLEQPDLEVSVALREAMQAAVYAGRIDSVHLFDLLREEGDA